MRLDRDCGPCSVCGNPRARYEHEGQRYCVRRSCQLVAAGMWTRDKARADLAKRGYSVAP